MPALTPRENFIRFFKGQQYEWMPCNRDQKRFMPDMFVDNICRGFVFQEKPFPRDQFGGRDVFGVEWVFDPASGGSMDVSPIMEEIEEWESKVRFPDLAALDWEGCIEENRAYLQTDKLLMSSMFSSFFERLISFLGFEKAAMALIDEEQKAYTKALFDRLADYYIEKIRLMHQYFNIELIELHDDWGTQRSPTFSVEVHNEMIVPYVKKVVDAAHREGVFVEMHSCGYIVPLIPGLISTGADTWRGQELNDKLALVRQYGDRFKFGVEIRPEGPISDEEAVEMARRFLVEYKDQTVWLAAARTLSPAQVQLVYDEIYQKQAVS